MVEEQVEVEVLVADGQRVLPADEGEAAAEFEQELFHVSEQAGFEFALVEGLFEGEEVEEVGVFEKLLREVGVGGAGRVAAKLVTAAPWRSWARFLIWTVTVSRLQPCSKAWRAYQRRVGRSGNFCIRMMLCPQLNWATACAPIGIRDAWAGNWGTARAPDSEDEGSIAAAG